MIERQFNEIIRFEANKEKFKSFKRSDDFWIHIIEMNRVEKYAALFDLIKSILILLHGDAAFERRLFVNKEINIKILDCSTIDM